MLIGLVSASYCPNGIYPCDNSLSLSSNDFNAYIADKYQSFDPYSTVYQYQKIITQLDINTNTTTVNTITISQDTYNTLSPSSQTYNLPTGPVSISITPNILTIFAWELQQNENNRNIKRK